MPPRSPPHDDLGKIHDDPQWSQQSTGDYDSLHHLGCLPCHGRTEPVVFRNNSDFGNHTDIRQECFQFILLTVI